MKKTWSRKSRVRLPLRDSPLTKFFILLIQNKDFEILEHRWVIWVLNDKYSSKKIPNNLKLLSSPSLCILSICETKAGSAGWPGSLLLNCSTHSSGLITFPLVRNTMNLVLDVLTAILLALNHNAIFCSSLFTNSISSLSFFLLKGKFYRPQIKKRRGRWQSRDHSYNTKKESGLESTFWDRPDKYVLNHLSALPLIPILDIFFFFRGLSENTHPTLFFKSRNTPMQ